MSKRRTHKAPAPPRKTGTKTGGRPSHKEEKQKLWNQIETLRELLHHRRHNHATWQLIKQILDTRAELEDLATPLRSRTLDNSGHPAEVAALPGVTMAPAGPSTPEADDADPGYDETKHKGSRELKHVGSYAQDLLGWYDRMLHWTVDTTQKKLRREIERPRPSIPKPPQPVKLSETETA